MANNCKSLQSKLLSLKKTNTSTDLICLAQQVQGGSCSPSTSDGSVALLLLLLLGRRLSSSNCSFIVYRNHSFAKKSLPVRNTHIYPCYSAGYQNKLLFTNSQTVHTNDLDDAWAGCKAGSTGHSKSWTVATWLHCHMAFLFCIGLTKERDR